MKSLYCPIGALLLLILSASLATGWWLDHHRLAPERPDLQEKINALERKLGMCEERRDDIQGRYSLLWKVCREFVNKPGYEEFKERFMWFSNAVRN